MTNGQMNVVTMLPTVLAAGSDQIVSSTASTDGIQLDSGAFAGLLSGIQSQTAIKGASDSGQAEQLQSKGESVSAEELSVDLLALIQGLSQITPASEPAVQQEEPEKADVVTNSTSLANVSAAASQVVLAAYSHSGRKPEVNFPTQHVDGLQNVAAVSEQPSEVAALPDAKTVTGLESWRTVAVQPASTGVGELPTVSVAADSSCGEPAKAAEKQPLKFSDLLAEVPQLQTSETVQSLPVGVHPVNVAGEGEQSDRISIVNSWTTASGGNQHHKNTATGISPLLASVPDKAQVMAANAEPVQVTSVQPTVILSENKASVIVADSNAALYGTSDVEVSAKLSDKTAPASGMVQGQAGSVRQLAPAPVPSSVDVEVQLSQQQPIIARAAAVSVSAGNRSAAQVQEAYSARQRTNPEQQQEVVKEMASSQHGIAVPEESALSSELTSSEDSNQKQSDVASDNLMPMQDMRGQVKAEHQKVASFSSRPVAAEPARENVSEQVMQQVKDRLAQHDVKPGSQQITLTLSPDSLGELKMNLNLQGQNLSVEIVTENKAVRDSIVLHADALKDSLGRQNIIMESFDVTTGGKGSGNQGQNQNAWRELAKQQQQQQFWGGSRGYAVAQADLPAGNAAYMKQQGQSMLDIHY